MKRKATPPAKLHANCPRCGGTGYVTDPKVEGAEMRAKRTKRGIGLREAARRVGVSPAYLCDLEHGRRRWSQKLRALLIEIIAPAA